MAKKIVRKVSKRSRDDIYNGLLNKIIVVLLLAVILVGLVSLLFYLQLSPLSLGAADKQISAGAPQALVSLQIMPHPEKAGELSLDSSADSSSSALQNTQVQQ